MNNSPHSSSNITVMPSVMRIKDVIGCTGLSRATIYRLMGTDKFPRSFKIGETATGWLEGEVRAWISDRALSRQAAGRDECTAAA